MKYLVLFFLSLSSIAFGADLSSATQAIEKDLKAVNATILEQQTKIFEERQALRRSALEISDKLGAQSNLSLEQEIQLLQSELKTLERELEHQNNILKAAEANANQLRRELPTLFPAITQDSFTDALETQDELLKNNKTQDFYSHYFSVLHETCKNGSQIIRRSIQASDEGGTIKEMQALSLGYGQFFLSDANKSGIGSFPDGDSTARLRSVPGLSIPAQLNGAALPVDFSDGLVFKDEAREKSLAEHIKKGGIVIYPLLFLGLICFLAGLAKTVHLYLVRSSYDDKVSRLICLIRDDQLDEAQALVDAQKDPVKRLLQEALTHRDIKREDLEERLNEAVLSQLPKLDSFLSVLSVSAGAAPLLGLLGTVMGIIKTFEMIGIYGTGDANRMAGGISEALVTTEIGLIVAIPALIWHAILNRRLRKIMSNLDKAILSFINAVKLQDDKK